MAEDTNNAYRLRECGIETAPVVDRQIDPKSWVIVDFDLLDKDTAKYLRGMASAVTYAQRID